MPAVLTDKQRLVVDLELPEEAWESESYDASLFRLIFWTGYVRGRADECGALEAEVRSCASTP